MPCSGPTTWTMPFSGEFPMRRLAVDELLYEGTLRAQKEAQATLIEVKKAMGFTGVWNRIRRAVEKRQKRFGD